MPSIKNFPLKRTHTLAPFTVLILALTCYFFEASIFEALVYKRNLFTQGEVWRGLTAHFFHSNGYHLLLNSAAVFMLWALHGHFYSVKNYTFIFLISALICTFGVHYFSAHINQYVGLSGVLHGIFIWGAMLDIKAKEKTGYLLFIGVILKIAHEQYFGASTDVAELIGARVAINAHLWGAIGGFIGGLLLISFEQKKKPI